MLTIKEEGKIAKIYGFAKNVSDFSEFFNYAVDIAGDQKKLAYLIANNSRFEELSEKNPSWNAKQLLGKIWLELKSCLPKYPDPKQWAVHFKETNRYIKKYQVIHKRHQNR